MGCASSREEEVVVKSDPRVKEETAPPPPATQPEPVKAPEKEVKEPEDNSARRRSTDTSKNSFNKQAQPSTSQEPAAKPGSTREAAPDKAKVEAKKEGDKKETEGSTKSYWPTWLTNAAGAAVEGWKPRSITSFQKISKIGQGTYSSVYKAVDLQSGDMVALKKVRFDNLDPESIKFMAREIQILRQLDHPNVVKLLGIATSKDYFNIYLIFEFLEHDLTGLAARPDANFSQAQIKCYMKQILMGLKHCHEKGVLHRDIKASNMLLDNKGQLKLADFGLAAQREAESKEPLTTRVITLWYRPPELLLGATTYNYTVDLWSVGCILAELLLGKPPLPGRTEVEQLHKIFKLCGSPGADYQKKAHVPHSSLMITPPKPYPRKVTEDFAHFAPEAVALVDLLLSLEPSKRGTAAAALNEPYFTTAPLPLDPSLLPTYPSSHEYFFKKRRDKARREGTETKDAGKGGGAAGGGGGGGGGAGAGGRGEKKDEGAKDGDKKEASKPLPAAPAAPSSRGANTATQSAEPRSRPESGGGAPSADNADADKTRTILSAEVGGVDKREGKAVTSEGSEGGVSSGRAGGGGEDRPNAPEHRNPKEARRASFSGMMTEEQKKDLLDETSQPSTGRMAERSMTQSKMTGLKEFDVGGSRDMGEGGDAARPNTAAAASGGGEKM